MNKPILLLIFNRPDTTRLVFDAIRAAKPPKLYIAADGPRAGRQNEAERCMRARAIATQVDWPCEVHTLFRDHNLGCKLGVSGGISWFFEHEFEGIILEDDVLPTDTFFEFCEEMLDRYRDDERVAVITGNNLISDKYTSPNSYFFSRYPHIWGWASWRRAWKKYDVAMTDWPLWRDVGGLRSLWSGGRFVEAYWRHYFGATFQGLIDTWDYQWFFACWRSRGLTIVPTVNQTRNLGFGADATHTTGKEPVSLRNSRSKSLRFPLIHPTEVEWDRKADSLIDSQVFGITAYSTLKRYLKSVPVLANFIEYGKYFLSSRHADKT